MMNMLLENEVSRSVTVSVNEDVECGGADLRVEREDIRFYNVAPDRLRIEVTVHNRGVAASRAEPMLLEAAPLGAFVPWRPLQRLQVPAIAAGESRVVSTEVELAAENSPAGNGAGGNEADAAQREAFSAETPGPAPSDRSSPAWVLQFLRRRGFEGLNAWDIAALFSRQPIRQDAGFRSIRSNLFRALEGATDASSSEELESFRQVVRPGETSADDAQRIVQSVADFARTSRQILSAQILSALDPSRIAGRGNKHWAGNINVYLGGRAVERHQARGLKIYPGIENWALFNLGSRKGEEYLLNFTGTGAEWDARVFHLPNAQEEYSAAREMQGGREQLGEGIGSGELFVTPMGSAWMAAMVNPPEDAAEEKLNIDIQELSSGRSTTVEFQMMANASGGGFYTF